MAEILFCVSFKMSTFTFSMNDPSSFWYRESVPSPYGEYGEYVSDSAK